MKITQELTLDTSRENAYKVVHAKQFDEDSRFLKVAIVTCGEEIAIDSGSTVILGVQRSDLESRTFDGVVNGDGTVTVPLPNWMLKVSGKCVCDISVISDGEKLSTLNFTVLVECAPVNENNIYEEDEYDTLVELIYKAEAIVDHVDRIDKTIMGGYDLIVSDFEALTKLPDAQGRVLVKNLNINRTDIEAFNNSYYTGNLLPYPYADIPDTFDNESGSLIAQEAVASGTFAFINKTNGITLTSGEYIFEPNLEGDNVSNLRRSLFINDVEVPEAINTNWDKAIITLLEDTEITSLKFSCYGELNQTQEFKFSPVLYRAADHPDGLNFKFRYMSEIDKPIPTKFKLSCDTIEFIDCTFGDSSDTKDSYIEFIGGNNTSLRGVSGDGGSSKYSSFSQFWCASNVNAPITLYDCTYVTNCRIHYLKKCYYISNCTWQEGTGDGCFYIDPLTCASANDDYYEGGKIPLIPDVKGKNGYLDPNLLSKYDHVITTEDEFANLGNFTGRVLVKSFDFNTSRNITLSSGLTLLEFDGIFAVNEPITVTASSNSDCTLKGGKFYVNDYKSCLFKNFARVESVIAEHSVSSFEFHNCKHISNSKFPTAIDCDYIDNCTVNSVDNYGFIRCSFICGIASTTLYNSIQFDDCSYISNITCDGIYKNCKYVDVETCQGFIPESDVGKVQTLTANGSYSAKFMVDLDQFNNKLGDIDNALDSIIAIQNRLIGGDSV